MRIWLATILYYFFIKCVRFLQDISFLVSLWLTMRARLISSAAKKNCIHRTSPVLLQTLWYIIINEILSLVGVIACMSLYFNIFIYSYTYIYIYIVRISTFKLYQIKHIRYESHDASCLTWHHNMVHVISLGSVCSRKHLCFVCNDDASAHKYIACR